MAIVLKATNSSILINAKYSYLLNNYSSGVSTIVLVNSAGFTANDYILFGEFGNESSEIVQVDTVTAATHTLTLKAATKFAHAESTKITILPYNQVQFYRTTTTTFSASSQIGSNTDIQADSLYTIISDTTNTTGYGWYRFYNATTLAYTQNSNYISYTGFATNSVKKLIEDFFSQLSITEQKLITTTEVLSWLSEAYSVAREELNLVNKEFNAQDKYELTTTADLAEYSLMTNLDHVISVWNDTDDVKVEKIDLSEVEKYNDDAANTVRYYIRGSYIGFSPTPDSAIVFQVRYTTKSGALTSYTDTVDLPGNNHYILKDYALFRAAPRLKRADGAMFLANFYNGIKRIKLIAKRDSGLDSFGIADNANV